MKTQHVLHSDKRFLIVLVVTFSFFIFSGCQLEPLDEGSMDSKVDTILELRKKSKKVVQVSSDGYSFNAPNQIESGWTTFTYANNSEHPHFFILERMPEGYDVSNSINEVVPPFQEGMYYIMDNDWTNALAAFGNLPAWYFQVVINGGPGMVSPKTSATTTVHLTPGTYVIECYVKMPDGTFHTSLGMIDQIIVTDTDNGHSAPKSDVDIDISSTNGIEILSEIKPGLRTFAVHFQDQVAHENFLGHDVHLVKLEDTADVTALDAWMNWSAPAGLSGHGPQGMTFMGGTQEAPAGSTAYFTALLKPGTYALVAEVPNPTSKGMLQTFTIPNN